MPKRKQILLLLLAVILLPVIWIFFRDLGGKTTLQKYRAELRAKGDKLTFAELALAPSTNTEEIAARAKLITAGFSGLGPTALMLEFVAPGKARVAWRGDLHLDDGKSPSPTNTWERFDHENDVAHPSLENFQSALQTPPADSGWDYDDNFVNLTNGLQRLRPAYLHERLFTQALVRQLIGQLHQGKFDDATKTLHALINCAQMYRNEPDLNAQAIRGGMGRLGLSTTWQALQSPQWTESLLADLQHNWETVDFLSVAEMGLQSERAQMEVVMSEIRRVPGPQFHKILPAQTMPVFKSQIPFGQEINQALHRIAEERFAPAIYRLLDVNNDELFALSHLTGELDSARALRANHPWPAIYLLETNRLFRLNQTISSNRPGSYRASAYLIPNFTRFLQNAAQAETERRLTITAIALKRFQLAHGHPPATLADLTPAYLTSVPIDPMSGKQLCFRPNADGTFVLYSVGEDGHDDGGTPGMGIWQGSDAVWPVSSE